VWQTKGPTDFLIANVALNYVARQKCEDETNAFFTSECSVRLESVTAHCSAAFSFGKLRETLTGDPDPAPAAAQRDRPCLMRWVTICEQWDQAWPLHPVALHLAGWNDIFTSQMRQWIWPAIYGDVGLLARRIKRRPRRRISRLLGDASGIFSVVPSRHRGTATDRLSE